jgi:uncharacterized protein (DUF1800 family)
LALTEVSYQYALEFKLFFTISKTMNRRNFFTMLTHASSERVNEQQHDTSEILDDEDAPKKPQAQVQSGLEPYTLKLDRTRALHLLRRVGFAGTNAQVNQLVGKTAQEAVNIVLGTTEAPLPDTPGTWTNDITENPDRADTDTRNRIIGTWGGQFGSLQVWWVNLMLGEQFPAREKIVLFWSGHFTSEFTFDDTYNPPQLLYRQNQVLRQDAFGDVRKMAEDIAVDGAMLNYLGGTLNSKGAPNENFARELLELFTIGLGNYTEGDVKEAARVLTGWRCSRFNDEPRPNGAYNSYFVPQAHDTGAKQVLGISIPAREVDTNTEFLVRQGEVRRLIDIVFQERASAAAQFLSAKLYRYFVYSNPANNASSVITQMADVLRNNSFRVRPLLQALFTSAHFYDDANIGVQIKTPAEFVIGLARQLGVNAGNAVGVMNSFEQVLIDPPNVAGWDGYRTWLSTKTFPLRVQYAQQLIQGMSNDAAATFARQFSGSDNVQMLVSAITEFLLPKPVSTKRLQSYVSALLQGAPDYEWSSILRDSNSAGTRVKALLTLMVKAPDMQLC